MAQAVVPGIPVEVTLATTCVLLTWSDTPQTLVIWESSSAVYLVTGVVADGAALPATAYRDLGTVAAGSFIEIDISYYGQVLLASTGAGTCTIEVR